MQLQAFEYLLEHGAKISLGSPLAALLYTNGPRRLHGNVRLVENHRILEKMRLVGKMIRLVEKVLAKTEDINAYCNSVIPDDRLDKLSLRLRSYGESQALSPLQAAALHGQWEIIYLLLEKDADVNCPARGDCGVTPLQAICFYREGWRESGLKVRIVELFLDREVNVNAAPAWNRGLTALQVAAYKGDLEVASLLLSRGADVNAPACKVGGGTALAIAAREGHMDMVRFLLKSGAAVPAAGVTVSSFGVTHDDNKKILDLLRMSAPELTAMYGGNDTTSRDYHEYEAEWADDPTYNSG